MPQAEYNIVGGQGDSQNADLDHMVTYDHRNSALEQLN